MLYIKLMKVFPHLYGLQPLPAGCGSTPAVAHRKVMNFPPKSPHFLSDKVRHFAKKPFRRLLRGYLSGFVRLFCSPAQAIAPTRRILPENLSDTHSAVPVTLSRNGDPCALQYTCIDLSTVPRLSAR